MHARKIMIAVAAVFAMVGWWAKTVQLDLEAKGIIV